MTGPRHARVLSPAKINLGLEILGRREDGYHEIRSVLAMVDLVDEISISTADDLCSTRLDGVPGVAVENNLILRAVSRFAAFTGVSSAYDIHVHKRIPAAAGLGGASSNAAATILALNAMHGSPIGEPDLHALASELGSDVPFFLGSPVAAVSGRGTDLAPLPALHGVVLIAVPRIDLPGKTGFNPTCWTTPLSDRSGRLHLAHQHWSATCSALAAREWRSAVPGRHFTLFSTTS
jgi:4-diphosphocytidyl-2-C-methyl-D-erythritol kinase